MGMQQDLTDEVTKQMEDEFAEKKKLVEPGQIDEKAHEPVGPTHEQVAERVEPLLKENLEAACNKRKSEIAFKPGAVPKSLLDFQFSDDDEDKGLPSKS